MRYTPPYHHHAEARLQYFSTGDVARRFKKNVEYLRDLLRRGKIPEPAMRVSGRRFWTDAEIEAARPLVKNGGRK